MRAAVEILVWTLIWPLLALVIDRLIHPRTPERRVARLLAWYPRRWRREHGDEMADLLHDAIADGRDGLRLTFDVAREGLLERARATSRRRVAAGFLTGTGWTMVRPQGIVACILGQFAGLPPSWFLGLHVEGAAMWLVCGAMVAVGMLLVDRGMRLARSECRAVQNAG